MTPEDDLRKAGKAREILNSEIFKEAFAELEAVILSGIRQSAFKDAELREKLCARYDLLHSLRDQIQSYVDTGEFVEADIRRKNLYEQAMEKLKDFY